MHERFLSMSNAYAYALFIDKKLLMTITETKWKKPCDKVKTSLLDFFFMPNGFIAGIQCL